MAIHSSVDNYEPAVCNGFGVSHRVRIQMCAGQ